MTNLSVGQPVFFSDWANGPALRVVQVNGDSADLVTADCGTLVERVPFANIEPMRLGDLPYRSKKMFFRVVHP